MKCRAMIGGDTVLAASSASTNPRFAGNSESDEHESHQKYQYRTGCAGTADQQAASRARS